MPQTARVDVQVAIPANTPLAEQITAALQEGHFVVLTSDGKPLAEVRPLRPLLGTVRYSSDEGLMSSEWSDE